MVIYDIYVMIYDMILWYDRIWYDIRYDKIWYDTIWYDTIWYDVCYDIIYGDIWYDILRYDIIYDMTWHDRIWYDIFVNGNLVASRWQQHGTQLHTNNAKNNTKQTVHRTPQKFWKCAGTGRALLFGFYPGFCLTTEGKAQKNLSQGGRKVPPGTMKIHKYTIKILPRRKHKRPPLQRSNFHYAFRSSHYPL